MDPCRRRTLNADSASGIPASCPPFWRDRWRGLVALARRWISSDGGMRPSVCSRVRPLRAAVAAIDRGDGRALHRANKAGDGHEALPIRGHGNLPPARHIARSVTAVHARNGGALFTVLANVAFADLHSAQKSRVLSEHRGHHHCPRRRGRRRRKLAELITADGDSDPDQERSRVPTADPGLDLNLDFDDEADVR